MHKFLGHMEELFRAAFGIFHLVKKFAAVPSRGGLLRERRGSYRTPQAEHQRSRPSDGQSTIHYEEPAIVERKDVKDAGEKFDASRLSF